MVPFFRSSVLALAAAVILLAGCANILGPGPKDGQAGNPGGGGAQAVSIRTLIGELSANLKKDAQFSQGQTEAVAASAQKAVDGASLDPANLEASIPVAVSGAEAGLNQAGLSPEQKVLGAKTIAASFVSSLNGRFEATGKPGRSSRALALNAQVVTALLARISQAAVAGLKDAGIEPDRLGATAGAVVGNMIASLDNGGVNKALVSEALVQITQNAVSSLKQTGLSGPAALAAAVQSVTCGAVSAVAAIQVEGVSGSDYPALTGQITQGASAALGAIGTTKAEVKDLVAAVAAGSSDGITQVFTDSQKAGGAALETATVLAMVQGATQGASVGVMKNEAVSSSDASELIGAVTSAASQQMASRQGGTGLEHSAVRKAVTVGASAAAQTIVPGGLDAAALAQAIVLRDAAGTSVAADSQSIQTGVALGKNRPPVPVPGADQTVTVGTLVNLDGTGSRDPETADQTKLKFQWSLTSKPARSAAFLGDASKIKASLVPDAAGIYIVSLRVADEGGAEAEAFLRIEALADGSNVLYGGLTVQGRLDRAWGQWAAGDWPGTRDELLTILGHYPETPAFAEAHLLLGRTYYSLEQRALARDSYLEACALAGPGTAVGADARMALADFLLWTQPEGNGFPTVQRLCQEVIAAQPGTNRAFRAQRGQAEVLRAAGKPDDAVAALKKLLDQPLLDPVLSFEIHRELGELYAQLKRWDLAKAEYESLPALAVANTGSGDSLSVRKWGALQAQYWFAWQAQDDPASGLTLEKNGTPILTRALSDPDLAVPERLEAARNLAERGGDLSAEEVKKTLGLIAPLLTQTAAVSDLPSLRNRLWLQYRTAGLHNRLRYLVSSAADREAALAQAMAGYQAVQELGWGKWYGWEPAAYALVDLAGCEHWDSQEAGHDDRALAWIKKAVTEYPDSAPPRAKAVAQLRQGSIYLDLGRDRENQGGLDYQAWYQRALAAFGLVTPALYPTVDRSEWMFRQAVQSAAEAQMGLKNYPAAVTACQSYLQTPPADAEGSAWVQLTLARCYGQQALQKLQEGNSSAALGLWTGSAVPAFDAVAGYKDGRGKPVSRGEPASQALFEKGNSLRSLASKMRWSLGFGAPDWTPLFRQAADSFHQVSSKNFPELSPGNWQFQEAPVQESECLFGLGEFAAGRTALEGLLGQMAGGLVSDRNRWSLERQLADSYRQEANGLGDGLDNAQRLALQQKKLDLNLRFLDLAEGLYTRWLALANPSSEASDAVAWVLNQELWSYSDARWALGWDSSGGNDGYSEADKALMDGWNTKIGELRTRILGSPALQGANGGRSLPGFYRALGQWYQGRASQLSWSTPWSQVSPWYRQALEAYEKAAADPRAEMSAVQECLVSESEIHAQIVRRGTDLEERKTSFEKTLDLWKTLLANPRADISQVARAAVTAAQLYADFHGSHGAQADQLGGLGLTGMDGKNAWQTMVVLLVKPIAEKTDNYAKLDQGWIIDHAQRLMKGLENGSLTVQVN